MKRSLISVLVLFSIITANAQLKPLAYSSAVKADKTSQKELYKQGKHWYGDIFNCSGKKLTLDDPIQSVIVGKCSFPYTSKVQILSAKTKGEVQFQVKLRFKEGRYEFEFSDFRHVGSGISFDLITQEPSYTKDIPGATPEWKNQVWNDIKAQAKANSDGILKSLIAEMSNPGGGK